MRRHLPWIGAAAIVAALAVLLLVASRPPVARAPTAAPSRTADTNASGTLATNDVSASAAPTASGTPRITPPPGSASLPPEAGPTPEGYRAPPDTFDASSIRWAGDAVTGSSQEKRFGLWTARLDGSDLREVVTGEVGTGQSLVTPDGAVAFIHVGRGRPTPLFLARPAAEPVEVLPWATEIALGPDGLYALAVTTLPDGTVADDGVWLLATGTDRVVRVVPRREGPGCDPELFGERTRTGIAASATAVATGVCVPDGTGGFRLAIDLFDRAAGATTTIDVNARPLGFDRAGRLVAHGDDAFVALDPTTQTAAPLGGDPGGQARLAGAGRWLVTFGGGRDVTAHDLNDGRVTTWDVPAGGTFDLTPWGDDGHAVLESFAQFPAGDVQPGWHAVLGLAEGWIGYLPPIAPFRDDPPE